MAKTFKNMALAGVAALGMASAASAATLSIVGGTAGVIPGGSATNQVLTGLALDNPMSGYFGASIQLSDASLIQVDVMGYEAGFMNSISIGGFSFTSSPTGPNGTIAADLTAPLASSTVMSGTPLTFTFSTSGTAAEGVVDGDVANGDANINTAGYANFFASTDASGAVWLFFDDGGAAGDDDNHDDLVIRISAVPLPAGAFLMLTGLGAFALRRRKES